MTWLTIVICLGTTRCERHQLPLDAGPLACLTAQALALADVQDQIDAWRRDQRSVLRVVERVA